MTSSRYSGWGARSWIAGMAFVLMFGATTALAQSQELRQKCREFSCETALLNQCQENWSETPLIINKQTNSPSTTKTTSNNENKCTTLMLCITNAINLNSGKNEYKETNRSEFFNLLLNYGLVNKQNSRFQQDENKFTSFCEKARDCYKNDGSSMSECLKGTQQSTDVAGVQDQNTPACTNPNCVSYQEEQPLEQKNEEFKQGIQNSEQTVETHQQETGELQERPEPRQSSATGQLNTGMTAPPYTRAEAQTQQSVPLNTSTFHDKGRDCNINDYDLRYPVLIAFFAGILFSFAVKEFYWIFWPKGVKPKPNTTAHSGRIDKIRNAAADSRNDSESKELLPAPSPDEAENTESPSVGKNENQQSLADDKPAEEKGNKRDEVDINQTEHTIDRTEPNDISFLKSNVQDLPTFIFTNYGERNGGLSDLLIAQHDRHPWQVKELDLALRSFQSAIDVNSRVSERELADRIVKIGEKLFGLYRAMGLQDEEQYEKALSWVSAINQAIVDYKWSLILPSIGAAFDRGEMTGPETPRGRVSHILTWGIRKGQRTERHAVVK